MARRAQARQSAAARGARGPRELRRDPARRHVRHRGPGLAPRRALLLDERLPRRRALPADARGQLRLLAGRARGRAG